MIPRVDPHLENIAMFVKDFIPFHQAQASFGQLKLCGRISQHELVDSLHRACSLSPRHTFEEPPKTSLLVGQVHRKHLTCGASTIPGYEEGRTA